jgi:NhaP-type Na+/H+ or K+/H+ antiporter
VSSLSSGQIMLAAALIFGLATVSQIIAPRLRIPALILLLPAGFILGLTAPQFRMDSILGAAFPVVVDLVVAVILFHGGLEITSIKLEARDRRIVRRLVWLGGALTFVGATVAANLLLNLNWSIAFMLGAIVIVSGPTVVTPILDFAGLRGRVRGILQWEGTLLDPIGALVAVVVFQVIRASGQESVGEAVLSFVGGILVGVVAAGVGVVLFIVGGKLVKGNELLGTQVLLGSVIVIAGVANFLADETGLLAALLMGMAAPRLARKFGASLDSSQPFFGTLVSIGIGVLFVSIAALVPVETVASVLLPTLALSAVLILVLRPLVVSIGTARSDLSRRQRMFVACMDPRGIVAPATASSIGAALIALKVEGAEKLLPVAFIVVAVSVAVYGVCAVPLARALRLQDE